MGSGLIAVLVFIALTVGAAIVNKLLDDPITWVLARLLGGVWPRRSVGLKGTWRSSYDFLGTSGRRHMEQKMELRQFGRFISGRCVESSGEHQHRIRATLRDGVLTGSWENMKGAAQHRGVFQLLVQPDGEAMKGKWIGFDRRHHIQQNDWRWDRL